MVTVKEIVENYINGNKLDAVMQIKRYGELKFFKDLRETLYNGDSTCETNYEIMYECFANITITYFTHMN